MEAKLKLPEPHFIGKYLKEKAAIEECFDFFNCSITSKGLICNGSFSVPESSSDYDVRIIYNIPHHPKVFIINPNIEYNPDIHMYKNDSSICLYYPADGSWKKNSMLYNTIIPWTSEWLVYYELYKLKGKWLGKYKSH